MRLVHGDCDRYHSRRSLGLTDFFPVIKPSTTRALSGLLALGVASICIGRSRVGSIGHRSRARRLRLNSAVELRLRSPGRVDVVIAGLGTKVRAVSRSQSDGRWSARLTGVDLGDRPFTPQQHGAPIIGVAQRAVGTAGWRSSVDREGSDGRTCCPRQPLDPMANHWW